MARTVAMIRAAAGALARSGITVRPMIKLQNALLVSALASIALAIPVTIASADDDPTVPVVDDGSDTGVPATRSTPATITVTATVVPGQCQPVNGGPPSAQVTDTAGVPESSPEPVSRTAAQKPSQTPSSRFDPYTCAPVPAVSTSLNAAPTATSAIPSYTPPTLNPYPGQESPGRFGPGTSSSSGSGVEVTSNPLSAPTPANTISPGSH